MTTTIKHQTLVNDPVIRYKSVEALPGIGPVYGRRLRDAGFSTADKVLQKYLELQRNEQRFTLWISQVCDASSHFAALCFNGLNEWYLTWGKDHPNIKNPTKTVSIQNNLTNRMLLEQKILQFNFNSSDDRLRRLTQCQTMSLYDISQPQRAGMDAINKNQPKIFNGLQYSSESNLKAQVESSNKRKLFIFNGLQNSSESNLIVRSETNKKSQSNILNGLPMRSKEKKAEEIKRHSLTNLRSPFQKSVNFKRVEIVDGTSPRIFMGSNLPKQTVSPILKSRSLTPENKMPAHNTPRGSVTKLNSGLENTGNDLFEFPNEPESSNSECPTPVQSIDSLSESNTDRTNEVNEATNIECTCNFGAESVSGSETVNSGENIRKQTESDMDSGDITKKENIRLFCDMLSNDLEQLPMDKFRKLKLKILQLVYAEIDECGSK